jgi:serine/threonine protein kinase
MMTVFHSIRTIELIFFVLMHATSFWISSFKAIEVTEIARLYTRSGSLKDVLSTYSFSWAPKAKGIAVAGIVLEMKLLHGFGLIHDCLKPNNALFVHDHRIRIIHFVQGPLAFHEGPRLGPRVA